MKHFKYETYLLGILILSLLGWLTYSSFFLIVMGMIVLYFIYKTSDLKFALPYFINAIFVNHQEFKIMKVPYDLIILGLILVLIFTIYFWKNKTGPYKLEAKWGFIFLSISFFIPIFWYHASYQEFSLYLLYLNWVLYFLVYFVMVKALQRNITEEARKAFSYLGLLISLQCIISVVRIFLQQGNLKDIYSLGWGMCNEAGIVLCMVLPFAVLEWFKNKGLFSVIKLCVIIVGLFFTLSRGTYLFSAIMLFLFFQVWLSTKGISKRTLWIGNAFIFLFGIVFFVMRQELLTKIFLSLFNDNGRLALYQDAFSIFTRNPLYFILGSGIVSDFDIYQRVVVYHSTIYETLVGGGMIGMIALIVHWIEKYFPFRYLKTVDKKIIFIGYLIVDIYGLLDNTYHMYYYMILLGMMMAIFNKSDLEVEG